MTSVTRDFENEAVRKAQRRLSSILGQCGGDNVCVLQGQTRILKQKIEGAGNLFVVSLIDEAKHPYSLCDHQKGSPHASADKRLRSSDLPHIVPHDEANEDIRVNGAHASL